MSLRATAERVTDRVEDRLEPARETAAERIDDAGDRLRGAVRSAPDVAERVASDVSDRSREVAGRVSERSRDAADNVERYLEERLGEETLETWAPRLAFAVGGLVIGFLIGWAVRRNRRSRREEQDDGFAQAPRTAPGSGERPFQAVRNN